MKKNLCKGAVGLLLLLLPAFAFANGSTATGPSTTKAEPKVVRFGIHTTGEQLGDPTWRDPTGHPYVDAEYLRANTAAEQKVLDELNVKIQWVTGYDRSVDVQNSILASDPLADLIWVQLSAQSDMFTQGILQDLAPYASIFTDDPEASWMLSTPILGHDFWVGYYLNQVQCWPLVFNIDYIEAIPALKDGNGETIYPTTLYKQGNWTWSKWKEYLTQAKAYYANKPNPSQPEVMIMPYSSDTREMTQNLLHTAGQGIYSRKGIQVDTPEALKVIDFVQDLIDSGLSYCRISGDQGKIETGWFAGYFGNGGSVFSEMILSDSGYNSSLLAARGMSMGMIPYPRPDWLAANSPDYQQTSTPGPAFAALRGVSQEQTTLALQALKLYLLERYRVLADSSSALDYLKKTAELSAIEHGVDIAHPKIGQDLLNIYANYSPPQPNESCETMGLYWRYTEGILDQALYGLNGSPKYPVAVKEKWGTLEEKLDIFRAVIGGDAPTGSVY